MIFNNECNQLTIIGFHAKSLQDREGKADAAFGVAPDPLGLTDVVKQ
jgi:hypothetical protein